MLMSWVSLQQEIVKKSEKLMKIVNNDGENLYIFWTTSGMNFNEIFRKDVAYDNIKSHKKSGPHSVSLYKTCFWKNLIAWSLDLSVCLSTKLKLSDKVSKLSVSINVSNVSFKCCTFWWYTKKEKYLHKISMLTFTKIFFPRLT